MPRSGLGNTTHPRTFCISWASDFSVVPLVLRVSFRLSILAVFFFSWDPLLIFVSTCSRGGWGISQRLLAFLHSTRRPAADSGGDSNAQYCSPEFDPSCESRAVGKHRPF